MKAKQVSEPFNLPRPRKIDLARLPASRLKDMEAAADEVIECCRALAHTGGNLVGELLRDVETFFEWDHYPDGDVFDHQSHSQFYYHAHPQGERGNEHGHFHTFLRPAGMPARVKPALVPDFEPPEDASDALSHLIAVSMDEFGVPIRLFTVNRWVTGEVWYTAADVRAMLDCFAIDHAQPSWPVNRWISAMIRLYRPQIGALLDARDAAVEAWSAAYPDRNVFEDRDLDMTSMLDIDIDDHIARIRAARETKS